MPKSNFVVELVNAFNLCNYYFDDIYTNFTVKGAGVVGSFVPGTDIKEYSQKVKEEIIKRHYGTEEVASKYYNLNYFPFVLGDKRKRHVGKNLEVELASSINNEVIRNLKIHFTQEFLVNVDTEVAANLEKRKLMTVEEAHRCIEGSVRLGKAAPYLYYISFDDRYFKEKEYPNPSRSLELFSSIYIRAFNSELERCDLESSDFYKYEDGKLYIKDITNIDVIKTIAKHLRERIALDFKTPGTEDSKVENFKDILSGLIFKWTRKSIGAYEHDAFTNEKEREDGNHLALIPLIEVCDDQLETLKRNDIYKINAECKTTLVSDIRGKTEKTCNTNYKNPVYAISNKGIAQLLPEIMQSPIAYNERTRHFEFAADLGLSSRIDLESSRQGSVLPSVPAAEGTRVAVPAASVNTRDLLDAERIRERRNSDGRNLSADSALSSEFDASRPSSGTGMTDDSGVYSSQELPTSDPELDRGYPLRPLSRSVSSLSSSASNTSVGTVIGVEEDSSSESSLSRSASSEPSEEKSGRFSFTHDPGLPNGNIYDENMLVPSAKLSQMKLGSLQRDQGKELKRCSRLESEEGGLQSSRYQLPTQLSFTKVSGSQSQQAVSAAYNVQAGTNTQPQQMNPSLPQGTHENKWSQSLQPGPSGLSQQRPSLWQQGGHSSRTSTWSQPMDPWSLPALSGYILGFWLPTQADSRDKPLTEKEKELIKALLYAFNLNNYIWEYFYTNFIVENGKIASSINGDVNVEEYLQELRDCTIKEYCGTEEEAKEEGYDLNEFPFKFLSNCGNQETKVVANVSRGALLNLKKLFIRHEQGVEIEDIDINTVEEAVEFQKNSWVDSQVKRGYCKPQAAIESCYPDESVLKDIPIIKGKDGYRLDRIYGTLEVKSFMEKRLHAKGTSKDEKMKPKDNKDSGYSSGFTTDAEKGKKSPKRRSQSPVGRVSPEKSLKRDSSTLDAANLMQQPDISKSDRFSDKSSKEGSPDTGGGINMQYTGARKKITGESDICSANPWAVPGTAFVLDSVSHVKSNIDKLGEDFSEAIKVAEEGKFGSSKLEPRHQWLDRERHRRSTKQATEEESISNWVWE